MISKARFFGSLVLRFFFFFFLCSPLFYFVYKFGDPDQVAHDFYHYYTLYDSFDLKHTKSPFNMRVIGAFFIFLIHKSGLYYDTATRFDDYSTYMDERVWFAAVFFNFLMVVSTATIVSMLYKLFFGQKEKQINTMNSLLAGCIYLLGYGTVFFDLMPLTEAFSTFLFALMLWLFFKKTHLLIPLMLLCVFQREFNLVLLLVIASYWYLKEKSPYSLIIGVSAVGYLVLYFLIRKFWFYNPELSRQTDLQIMVKKMLALGINPMTMIKQSFLSLNLVILYMGVLVAKKLKSLPFDKNWFAITCLLFFSTIIITYLAGLGTNFGRLFYLASPLVACLLVKEAAGLTVSTGQSTGN